MDRNELMKLADRIEQADGPDATLFHKAYEAMFGALPWTDKYEAGVLGSRTDRDVRLRATRFGELVRMKAWEQAALMLVPDGALLKAEDHPEWSVSAVVNDTQCFAATPALALCAAALRSLEDGGDDEKQG